MMKAAPLDRGTAFIAALPNNDPWIYLTMISLRIMFSFMLDTWT